MLFHVFHCMAFVTDCATVLKRETFTVSRELEYFSESELVAQTGHERALWWPLVMVKELLDNVLDAAEQAGRAPVVEIKVTGREISITDNGAGIPPETVARTLDFSTRTSDKAAYISPTRGQQGNALKTILGIMYVLEDGKAQAEISAQGIKHSILVDTDVLGRRPKITHRQSQIVKTEGTNVRICASREQEYELQELQNLVRDYCLFNPHLSLSLNGIEFAATDPNWQKWLPTDPTSPHWYNPETLENLICSSISADNGHGTSRTVREFVSSFRGLSSTGKQTRVTDAANLRRSSLAALADSGKADKQAIARLLAAMQNQSKPVKPEGMGVLGEAHFRGILESSFGAETFRYCREKGFDADGLPYLVEAAFVVIDEDDHSELQGMHTGLNWSVPLSQPLQHAKFDGWMEGLTALLAAKRIAIYDDPVCLALHLAHPHFTYTDRGKSTVSIGSGFAESIAKAIGRVTKPWADIKRELDREHRQQAARLRQQYLEGKPERVTVKEAAAECMEKAYMLASDNGRLPAKARQLYYAARGPILTATGKTSLDSDYFCNTLLPDYMSEHPETQSWNVVRDARGHLSEPHSGRQIGIGTSEVRDYLIAPPRYEYGAVLYTEKEGFDELFEATGIPLRYDLALASSKGMNTTAARELLEGLSELGRKILVLHDMDKAGFSILGTLQRETRRYQFDRTPEIIDLGLRLEDVRKWKLQAEPVDYNHDPAPNLRLNGATAEEIEFLRRERVELNAFTADQLVEWLEDKLEKHGIRKVVPDENTLRERWLGQHAADLRARLAAEHRRQMEIQVVEMLPEKLRKKALALLQAPPPYKEIEIRIGKMVPKGLRTRVAAILKTSRELPWHGALGRILEEP